MEILKSKRYLILVGHPPTYNNTCLTCKNKECYQQEPTSESKLATLLDSQIRQMGIKVVTSKLNYLAPLDIYRLEKPYLSRLPAQTELRRTNILAQTYNIEIFDVSGNEQLFTLDQSGFEFVKFPSTIRDWTDQIVRESYIPNLKAWLEASFDCSKVHIYAYNVRKVTTTVNIRSITNDVFSSGGKIQRIKQAVPGKCLSIKFIVVCYQFSA